MALVIAVVVSSVVVVLLFGAVSFYAVRPGAVAGPLLHVTTAEGLARITADVPGGWVHLRPGRWRNRRFPLLGWPPHPFAERICFYVGEEWPGWFRRRYNLPHPERFTYGIVVDAGALAERGGGGRLFRRPIDRSVAWSGEYRGPALIVERPASWESPFCARRLRGPVRSR